MHALRIVICFVLVWAIMSMPPYVQAAIEKQSDVNILNWKEADRIAAAMYKDSVNGNMTNIHANMKNFTTVLSAPGMFDHMTYEQMKAITDSVIRFKQTFVAAQQDEQKLERAAARLRLVIDAVTHEQDAMWRQYATVIMDEMKQMANAKSAAEWKQVSLQWLEHMDRLLPAASMDRSPEVIEMASSMIALVNKGMRGEVKHEDVQRALKDYESVILDNLFGSTKELETIAPIVEEPIPMQVLIWLGCIVTVTLAYVAYQKYRYDRNGIHNSPWARYK
ncbi:sporulation protein YpjB [Paenibacillus arenosi]|uniref:Sporulation protein YpjB n=1 Tax=Paenibacillus arenosi TaxID=2774142 RepID=A0ABR9AU06_9BACL|nr:sporulation protein YpjB [Paenibacillus arenosi]MBD8497595.1 hypothetical protein [Paenibacillus arenosi]